MRGNGFYVVMCCDESTSILIPAFPRFRHVLRSSWPLGKLDLTITILARKSSSRSSLELLIGKDSGFLPEVAKDELSVFC